MKRAIPQYAFTTGVISRLAQGRFDVDPLRSGVLEAKNVLPVEQGPLVARTGTEFIAEVKYSDKETALVEFSFSVSQALILEIGDYYIRFFKNGAPVIKEAVAWATLTDYKVGAIVSESTFRYRCLETHTSGTFATDLTADKWVLIEDADNAYEIVSPYPASVVKQLSVAGAADIMYIAHESHIPVMLSRYADDDWVLEDFSFTDGPFGPLNLIYDNKVYLQATSGSTGLIGNNDFFTEDMVGRLFRIQKRATTLADGAIALMTVTAFVDSNTLTVDVVGTVDAAFTDTGGLSDWRLGEFGYSTVTVVTVSGAGDVDANGNYYREQLISGGVVSTIWLKEGGILKADGSDVYNGWWFRKNDETRWTIYRTNTGSDSGRYRTDDGAAADVTPPTTNWYRNNGSAPVPTISVSSTSTAFGNWPSVVGLHQERLIFAASLTNPQTMWFSVTASYDSFAPTNDQNELLDDSAFTYRLSGGDINRIVWLVSAERLVIGTSGDEFISKSPDRGGSITPTDISFTRQTGRGSVRYQTPKLVGGLILYAQRLGSIIRAMVYDLNSDQFKSVDLTRLAEDILSSSGGFAGVAYSPEPSNVLYYYTVDGDLFSLTYEPDEKVAAWASIDIAGTDTVVKAAAAIPSSIGNYYDKYFIVSRTIDGATKQYVELLTTGYTDRNYWQYLDSSLYYHSDTTTIDTATGLDHLEGETVTIFADGYKRETAVVESGSVTLGGDYYHVIIGLPYTVTVRLLPIESELPDGNYSFGKNKRVTQLAIQLKDTIDVSVGVSADKLYPLTLDSDTDLNSDMYTVDIDEGDQLIAGDLYISHTAPYPFTLMNATREVVFHG